MSLENGVLMFAATNVVQSFRVCLGALIVLDREIIRYLSLGLENQETFLRSLKSHGHEKYLEKHRQSLSHIRH